MHVPPPEERVRDLCSKLLTAEGEEAETLIAELKSALHDHSEFVRQMAALTLTRANDAK